MTHYDQTNQPETLKARDTVTLFGLKYEVDRKENHLSNVTADGRNREVFQRAGLVSEDEPIETPEYSSKLWDFLITTYGYTPNAGGWPESRRGDMPALTRAVNGLLQMEKTADAAKRDGFGHSHEDNTVQGLLREMDGMFNGDKHELLMGEFYERQNKTTQERMGVQTDPSPSILGVWPSCPPRRYHMSERFEINGIVVNAVPLNNGMFVGIPENLMEALAAVLSGKLQGPLSIRKLTAEAPAVVPAPQAPASRDIIVTRTETISQYRARTGMSRTQTADMLNVSRRTLGRWEQKDKRMVEV